MLSLLFVKISSYCHYIKYINVLILIDIKDYFFINSLLPKGFVKLYYKYSPPIAQLIADSEMLKMTVRVLLAPVVLLVYAMFHPIVLLPIVTTMILWWYIKQKYQLV
ncbi:CFI-box-CTERM domain-containing protein [Ammoniphilus sp. 3BR4]|uniref:CFI-box-CTERM domain-containing protein n=1 Tax=Ammoniphilus sp. 3BR4 TaxID=3158265 RepID=UPI00346690DA